MMKLSKAILLNILLLLILVPSMQGQENKIMSFDSFMEIVEEHHPLSLQAELFPEQGRQGVKEARGGFDPKLISDLANKNFDGKTYYDVFEGGMKIPTWFGLEFYGGFEQNQGVFLNPERTVPDGGLAHAGVSLPVGRGLFIDKRRASLRQAQIAQRSSFEERRELRNQLFYEAAKAYWDWFKAYHVLEVYRDAQRLAEVRLRAVQQGAELGDRAFIDTLEAEIQVQNRQLSAQEALLELENARALLELFLWRDGIIPLELAAETIPVANEDVDARLPDQRFSQQIDSLAYLHPNLTQSRFKLEQLGIEQRLKREQLKPKLDLKYNFLTEPVGNNWVSNFNTNNYAWGFSFSMPLFLRKERAAINLNRLKMESLRYDISGKQESISTKAQIAINKVNNSFRQSGLARDRVEGYSRLLDAERRMFRAGESSLFLVNSRESSYVQAQVKYLDILVKNRKADLESRYSLGLLSDLME